MKNFSTVLGFELGNYFKNKSFMIWTLLISILAIGAMFLPRFVNLFGAEGESTEVRQMALLDENQLVPDDLLAAFFPDARFQRVDSEASLEAMVENEEAEAGFVVLSAHEYRYLVFNTLSDSDSAAFTALLQSASFVGAGYLGAVVYRSSTLRYGNPLKLRHVLRGPGPGLKDRIHQKSVSRREENPTRHAF